MDTRYILVYEMYGEKKLAKHFDCETYVTRRIYYFRDLRVKQQKLNNNFKLSGEH